MSGKWGRRTDFGPTRSSASAYRSWRQLWLLTSLILYDCRNDYYTVTDRRLEQLAYAIEGNLQKELDQLLATMEILSVRERQLVKKGELVDWAGNVLLGSEDPAIPRLAHRWYPWFEQIFWTDAAGNQEVKWSVREQPTPKTPVAQRPFFVVETDPMACPAVAILDELVLTSEQRVVRMGDPESLTLPAALTVVDRVLQAQEGTHHAIVAAEAAARRTRQIRGELGL
jgi:hypothetical protein